MPPQSFKSLFQIKTHSGWQVLIDSRIRKFLARMNTKLGYSSHYFTFHTFRRSGANLAFNSRVPIQQIKSHGTWTSECVWGYIQQDQAFGENIASSLANVVNARCCSTVGLEGILYIHFFVNLSLLGS